MSDDTATEIREATYRGFCRHRYADLVLDDVDGEVDRSESFVQYDSDTRKHPCDEFLVTTITGRMSVDRSSERFYGTIPRHAETRLTTGEISGAAP